MVAHQNLRTPGPTWLPDWSLQASARQMINHRGPEFRELLKHLTDLTKKAFVTEGDVFFLTSSGTGSLEAAVVNTLSPGDKVVGVTIGSFGDRFLATATAYGAKVAPVNVEWGRAVDPDEIRKALKANPDAKAVLVTHNETSTGVTNDLAAISKVVKGEFNKLLLVDAVSSVGSIPLLTDEWKADVVATASQKGWMAAPGLAPISMSATAWEANKTAKMPRVYFDLAAAKKYLERGETPWTPAIPQFYQMDTALTRIFAEGGMKKVWEHHARIGKFTRDGFKAMGLQLFPQDERYASNTCTAIKVPAGVDGKALLERVRKDANVVLAGGQGKLEGQIFRIGHMGAVTEDDIHECFDAVGKALPALGHKLAGSAAR